MKGILILLSVIAAFVLSGCDDTKPVERAVYYWRTTLTISEKECAFLADKGVDIVYLHLFDVVERDGEFRPSSTLRFKDRLPSSVKVIPVVFIESGLIKKGSDVDSLAGLIIRRADKMLTVNGYPKPDEIQIDYDWTLTNREPYFSVLARAREIMALRGGKVSTTIRLHQLSQPAPPVDYGALMVYNVGNITRVDEENSILLEKTVEPYLNNLRNYDLPLVTALPVYSWDIIFSGREFQAIAKSLNLDDTTMFTRLDENHFRCNRYGPMTMAGTANSDAGRIYPGDIVRNEFVKPETLTAVLKDIRQVNPEATRRLILYHLDEKSLDHYETEFLEKLFGGTNAR